MMAAHDDETRRVFDVADETARVFPNASNVSHRDEEMALDDLEELDMDIDISVLKKRRRRFSNKPDPRLRKCLWVLVPCVALTGLCAFAGLLLHWGGDAHPGARVRPPHPLSGGGLLPIIPANHPNSTVLDTPALNTTANTNININSNSTTTLNTTAVPAVPVQPVADPVV